MPKLTKIENPKTLKISEEAWEELAKLKIWFKEPTFDKTILQLVKEFKCELTQGEWVELNNVNIKTK